MPNTLRNIVWPGISPEMNMIGICKNGTDTNAFKSIENTASASKENSRRPKSIRGHSGTWRMGGSVGNCDGSCGGHPNKHCKVSRLDTCRPCLTSVQGESVLASGWPAGNTPSISITLSRWLWESCCLGCQHICPWDQPVCPILHASQTSRLISSRTRLVHRVPRSMGESGESTIPTTCAECANR